MPPVKRLSLACLLGALLTFDLWRPYLSRYLDVVQRVQLRERHLGLRSRRLPVLPGLPDFQFPVLIPDCNHLGATCRHTVV